MSQARSSPQSVAAATRSAADSSSLARASTGAAPAQPLHEGAERESVGDDGTGFGHHQQSRFGRGADLPVGPGKGLAKIDAVDGPAENFELGDDPAVIGVAAGRRGKITGHCEGEPLYHKLAS